MTPDTTLETNSNIRQLAVSSGALIFGYVLLALCVEALAIPPDFATPVWPSAGIALGFVLVFGHKMLPSVMLGAFAANSLLNPVRGYSYDLDAFLFALAIALGATVQAFAASWLLKKFNALPHQLTSGTGIIRFLLLAGPVSCFINASNGAFMLFFFDIVPADIWLSNWLVWWVGDSIGTLVMTPIALRVLQFTHQTQERVWQTSYLPIGFLIMVVILFFYVRNLEQNSRNDHIADLGRQFQLTFEAKILEFNTILDSINSFYDASEFVSVEEFIIFCKPLVDKRPDIHVIQWLPLVPHSERANIEQYLRDKGYPEFEFKAWQANGKLVPAPQKTHYMPITYLHPMKGNELVLGMDVLTLPGRERELTKALTMGGPFLSGPLQLMQQQGAPRLSYIIIAPVRDKAQSNNIGLVQIIFYVDSIVKSSVSDPEVLAALRIEDITDAANPILLHEHSSNESPIWSTNADILQHKIRLQLYPTPGLLKRISSWQSYALLIGGLFYVAMLEAVLMSIMTRQRFVELQVAIKTQELAHAKNEAERASQAKTAFLASMSHEFRTPLNAVIGFTHRVLTRSTGALDERSIDALKIVEKNGHHLLGLINDILDITKVEAGKLQLQLSDVSLHSLLKEAQQHFMLAAQAKHCEIIVESSYEKPIRGDEKRLRQIILNLVSNAIKFTEHGTITLSLKPKKRSAQQGVLLTVSDTGTGIAEPDLKKLFHKFEKITLTEGLNPQGTGLGLALVKEMTQLHHGQVNVKSKLGVGSDFSIWLPEHQPS